MNAPEHIRLRGANQGTVGVRTPLIDGVEKVPGKARYTADIAAPDALVGRILRSPVAHARIVSIDTREAWALKGVHGQGQQAFGHGKKLGIERIVSERRNVVLQYRFRFDPAQRRPYRHAIFQSNQTGVSFSARRRKREASASALRSSVMAGSCPVWLAGQSSKS